MSYDLFAQAFVNGARDPASERSRSVIEVLGPHLILGPDDDGFCRTRTTDGGEADFYLGTTEAAFMVNHFALGQTMELIYEAARAPGLVIHGPGLPALLTDAAQGRHLPPQLLGDAVLITSGGDLARLVESAS